MPALWCISAGRPTRLLAAYGFEPAPEGPVGHYRTPAPGWQVHLVVIRELPRNRDTVLLRLLGDKTVRMQAIHDIYTLPDDAWDRQLAIPWLIRLKMKLDTAEETTLSTKDKEIAMDVYAWFKQYEKQLKKQLGARLMQEGVQQGIQKGVKRGVKQGRMEGLSPLVHQFERRLGRALTSSERATLLNRLQKQGAKRIGDVVLDLSPERLSAWLAPRKPR